MPSEGSSPRRLNSRSNTASAMDMYFEITGLEAAMHETIPKEVAADFQRRMKETVKKLWLQYDTAQDGFLSVSELEQLVYDYFTLQHKNKELVASEIIKLDLEIDVDAQLSQIIQAKNMDTTRWSDETWNEARETLRRSCKEKVAQSKQKIIDGMSVAYPAYVANKDKIAQMLFKKLDRNADGKVNHDEFVGHFDSVWFDLVSSDESEQLIVQHMRDNRGERAISDAHAPAAHSFEHSSKCCQESRIFLVIAAIGLSAFLRRRYAT